MPLDPLARRQLEVRAELGFTETATLTVEEARRVVRELSAKGGPTERVASVVNRDIPGPGGPLPIRIYRPETPLGIVAFFHGSGFVLCDLETHDAFCRRLANQSSCTVVSVDYRLAPESPYPAAAEDCYAATAWAAEHTAELGIVGGSIGVVGDSAGGNLAAVVPLMAKARRGPALAFQVLIYPVLDRSFETPSYIENATGFGLTQETMRWYWNHYIGDESQSSEPFASPLRAPDLSGLPPALIITAEYDVLRDEGEAYYARLREAGVTATCVRYHGMIHGFLGMIGTSDAARFAMAQVSEAVRQGASAGS